MAIASGSYGAVVENGVRGCTTDDATGIVICFEAPTVDPHSRGVFLQVWPAARAYFGRSHADAVTLRVRSVSVTAGTAQASTTGITYVARADRVLPELTCSDDFRFHGSHGSVQLESLVSACKPA
jgi:hypothetical protein